MQLRNGKIICLKPKEEKNQKFKADTEISLETIVYIVNVTEHSFFRCMKKQYKPLLKELLTPPVYSISGESHWRRDDKIIFAPDHLKWYVEKTCSEIHPSAF